MSKRQDRDEQATQEACEGTESALKLKAAQSCAASTSRWHRDLQVRLLTCDVL
jgi:hypothetical protein